MKRCWLCKDGEMVLSPVDGYTSRGIGMMRCETCGSIASIDTVERHQEITKHITAKQREQNRKRDNLGLW